VSRREFATVTPLRLLSVALVAASLAACSATPGLWSWPKQARGSQVDGDQIKQLVPGTSTRQDVTSLLGSPTAKATFNENTWLYISQLTQPVIAGTQGIRAQDVYALTFDDGGVLRRVEKRTKEDALPVTVVSRTTPSPGSEASFLQQLLGNIGRFSPGSAPSYMPGQGSSANPGNF
jgi:outer membrane protein assembly factor BamE (lipoprotein component of BamABCDE complex)